MHHFPEEKVQLDRRVTVVVATYWTRPDGSFNDELFNVYDHPTPLSNVGTLPKLLRSLRKLKEEFHLLIVGTVTDPALNQVFEKRMRELLTPFKDLRPIFIGPSYVEKLRAYLADHGHNVTEENLNHVGYSNIRNMTLLGAGIIGTDIVVSLDDDEVITDPAYLLKAIYGVQKDIDERKILGKAGYYVRDREGNFLGSDDVAWWDRYWRKGYFMNQALKKFTDDERFQRATFMLGGNLVIASEIFERIPFDPACLRGEDCDYLINSRLRGFDFYTDNELYVLHEPPPHLGHIYGLRQDTYRFIYEMRKLEYARTLYDLHQTHPQDLDPYPGPFLRKDVKRKCATLAALTGIRDLLQDDWTEHFKLVKTALFDADRFSKKWVKEYFEFEKMWPEIMLTVKEDPYLRQELTKCIVQD